MKIHLLLWAAFVTLVASAQAQPDRAPDASAWEQSIVGIELTRKQYDFSQPWNKRTARNAKTGVLVGERQILTTADDVFDRTLVRLQKSGRGRWTIGEVLWVDYQANLAMVTTQDEAFWTGLKPVRLSGAIPAGGTLQIVRWREGKLENRAAEFTQYTVKEAALASINHVVLEVGSDIQGVGKGEPVIANSHVIGLTTAQTGRTCSTTPASFIQSILDARAKNEYRGLGFFHFFWQPAENLASLAFLKLPGEPRGVLVIDVPERPDGQPAVLKRQDVLLQIDGFDIDIEGDYTDPEFGALMLENLSTRRKWAGDEVKIKIWREGKETDVSYRLPKFEYTNSLLPDATYDQEPEYLVVGGLVFQPMTDSYLQSWGADWKRRAPFRLNYYNSQPRTKERPGLVILSQVLPDEYNIGYQDLRYLVVDSVNGLKISYLPDLQKALAQPVNGFHVIQMVQSDSIRKVVLAAGAKEQQATQRVLGAYNITKDHHIESQTTATPVSALLDAAREAAGKASQPTR